MRRPERMFFLVNFLSVLPRRNEAAQIRRKLRELGCQDVRVVGHVPKLPNKPNPFLVGVKQWSG